MKKKLCAFLAGVILVGSFSIATIAYEKETPGYGVGQYIGGVVFEPFCILPPKIPPIRDDD